MQRSIGGRNGWFRRKAVVGAVAILSAITVLYGCLESFYWLNYRRPGAIFRAVRDNDLAKIDLCLKYGANIESYEMYGWHRENKGDTPLTTAIQRSSSTTVAYLLEKGADPNRRWGVGGSTPAVKAAIRGDVTIIELLRDAGADFSVGVGDFTPLQAAIRSKHEDAVMAIRKILDAKE